MTDTDTRREQIAAALQHIWMPIVGRRDHDRAADAIMPILDAAIAAERERIAAALDRVPDEVYPGDVFGGPWSDDEALRGTQLLDDNDLPSYDRVAAHTMRFAFRQAARIARQPGEPT